MLRVIKPLLIGFAAITVMANCQSAFGQMVTYELGPFHVVGLGATSQEAESDAYGNLYDLLLDIEANLPEGHVLLSFVIEDEGLTAPDTYEIDFHVVIGILSPPGPPGGI
jgi:hypothetical protein